MKLTNTAKKILLLGLSAFCFMYSNAKSVEPILISSKEIFNDTVPANILRQKNDTAIENRLVQLALAQPQFKQTEAQNKILDYQLKKQRNNWMNLLSLSANYNDQTFAKPRNGNSVSYVYPKYFFGFTIPIGMIVANGSDIKITKQSQIIANEQQAELAKTIRADVLKNYKQYKANEKLLAIQNQLLDDLEAGFLQVEQKFKNGTATLDQYNDASKKYNDQSVIVINLQLQQDLVKVELERLIGMRLEDALK
ncbi:MAG: TolC family protein [Bacteroidetes bacterium]|nr:TolC family protein [Bacteroidota bacterium]